MTIKDIIKSSVYEQLAGGTGMSAYEIVLMLVGACLIGLYIYAVYKCTSKSAFYSKDLNITIAGLPVVTAAIMIAMQSNLLVSLGMVGALSIVRFRNAIKSSLDLLYLFWAISVGIIGGVGLYMLAVSLCIVMTGMLILLEFIPDFKGKSIIVLRSSIGEVDWKEIKNIIKKYCRYSKEKSYSVKGGEEEIIIELTTAKQDELLAELRKRNEIKQMNFLSHDGECRI